MLSYRLFLGFVDGEWKGQANGVDEMNKDRKKRILLGRWVSTLSNGIIIVAKWLSDAGFEVVYAGL
jgi:methylmalonyl-CoA mutase cobalamin-binding subunit